MILMAWEPYLKRKVASLPPVTQIDFDERKALAEQKQIKPKERKTKKEKKSKKNNKNVNKGQLERFTSIIFPIDRIGLSILIF